MQIQDYKIHIILVNFGVDQPVFMAVLKTEKIIIGDKMEVTMIDEHGHSNNHERFSLMARISNFAV